MTREILSSILRQKAKAICDRAEQIDPAMGEIYCEQRDVAEFLKALS